MSVFADLTAGGGHFGECGANYLDIGSTGLQPCRFKLLYACSGYTVMGWLFYRMEWETWK